MFERLQLQNCIDSYVRECGTNAVHDKGTYVEAMLGLTEMVAPKNSFTVVANIISLLNEMLPEPLPLRLPLFEIKLAKSAINKTPCRLSSAAADTLSSRAASKLPTADQKEEATSRSRPTTLAVSLKTGPSSQIRKMHQHWATAAKKQKPYTVVEQQNDGINAAALPDNDHVVPVRQKPPCNVITNNGDSIIRDQDAPYIIAVRRRAPMSLSGGVKRTVKENIQLLFLSL